MRRYGNIWWVSDDFVAYPPFLVDGILLGQVQRSSHYPHAGVFATVDELAAELLEMRPVISVETVSDLWTYVCQNERRVHGFLRPFRVRSRDLMAAVVTGASIIGE